MGESFKFPTNSEKPKEEILREKAADLILSTPFLRLPGNDDKSKEEVVDFVTKLVVEYAKSDRDDDVFEEELLAQSIYCWLRGVDVNTEDITKNEVWNELPRDDQYQIRNFVNRAITAFYQAQVITDESTEESHSQLI